MQAQMQAHWQRFNDVIKNVVNPQLAGSSTFGSIVNSAVNALDERQFRRIVQFNNKTESWKEWRTHFLTAVRESSPVTAEVMEPAETSEGLIKHDDVIKVSFPSSRRG